MRILNAAYVPRLFQLSQSSYRPKAILDLKTEIDGATRVAELRATVTGVVDHVEIERIIGMKLKLDSLYMDWTEGKFD